MEVSAFDEPMEEVKDYSNQDFKFMQSLAVHSGSVRAVATSEKGVMLSGSVDHTCKLFSIDETTGRYDFLQELNHHEHYVYSVSCALDNNGFYTCGKDQKIFLIDNHGNPEKLFEGHSQLVNMVIQVDANTIASGSWDGTAKIWEISTGKCITTYDGHSHAVTVFADPNGRLITGSQDKKIRIWGPNHKLVKEWVAHDDIIRKFADFSPLGFVHDYIFTVSCSNDSFIKVWTYDGELLGLLTGHTGYVFAVHALANHTIVSGSDDKTVKIWRDFNCVQSIDFPSTIWDIKSNILGDIVIASEDYKIYVFTRDSTRAASGTELAAFEADVKASNTAGEIDLAGVPHVDKISQYKGKKEGEIKIFKNNSGAEAYMWKEADKSWEKIGDVQMPSASPPPQSKFYEGDRLFEAGEYDHVFDVEIGDGVMRKLPFNNGANADEAANKFCVREGFGKQNIEQIIKFIKTNSLSYETRDLSAGKAVGKKVTKELKSFPMRNYIFFDQVKVDPPKEKIKEFNNELKSLDEKELQAFGRLVEVIGNKKDYQTSQIYKSEWDVLKKILSWPSKYLFPCLDLLRMFLNHSQASEMYKVYEHGSEQLSFFVAILSDKDDAWQNHLTTLKCVCNLFRHASSTFVVNSKYEKIIDSVVDFISHDKQAVRDAAVSVLLNYSILFLAKKDDNQGRIQSVSCLVEYLDQESDAKTFMKILATVGNLMFEDEDVKSLADGLGIKEKFDSVNKFKTTDSFELCSKFINEINIMLEDIS